MPVPAPVAFSHAGATLVAEEHGDPAGDRVLLLIHGIGMGRTVFAELIARLPPRWRLIAVDLPGYGEAPEPPRTLTMERTADLVAAYLRRTVPGAAIVLGHSMGSQVAAEVAARHPHLVSRLVLVAPTVDRHHRSPLAQLARLAADLLDESPKVLWVGAREYLRAGPNLRGKLRAMMAHRPERAYPRVAAPALVIRGEHDLVSPRRWCDEVVRLLPDARLALVAGHGHETLIRDAEPAARRIAAFVG